MLYIAKCFGLLAESIPLILILIIIKYYFDKRRLFSLGNRLPGPRPWPFIGNALEFVGKDFNYLNKITELNRKCGFSACWIGHKLYVHISTPEDAEVYFTSHHLLEKNENYKFMEPIVGKGLVTANGIEWKKARKYIEPAFRFSSLQGFTDVYIEQANILLQCLRKEEGNKVFNVYPYIEHCTFDIICETTMPIGLNAQLERVEALDDTNALMIYVCERFFNLWQQYDFLYKLSLKGMDHFKLINRIKTYIGSKVIEKKKSYQQKKLISEGFTEEIDDKKTLLDHFFENKDWDDNALMDHVLTIMAAGYETSASAISFILVMLGINQDVQEKLYNEISAAYENGTSEKELHRLKYLQMVIKETLRLYPTIPYIFRKADQDIQMGEHRIPKGASIGMNIYALHRNPKIYENPEAFNPDNFLPENISKRHPYSFLPFANGIRMCIGSKFAMMSIGILISKIVFNYKIECNLKMEDIKVKDQITLKMKNALYPIRIIKR